MAATIAGWVWVEGLTAVQRDNLRRTLTVRPRKTSDIATAKVPAPILLYREEGDRFGVPRGYWAAHSTGRHGERVAVSYGQPLRPLASQWRADPPFEEQADIIAALQQRIAGGAWGGGLLEAGCGTGKTNCAIEFAHRVGGSTMILVHKEFLLQQWQRRIQRLLPGARVGIVQQACEEWRDVDFCIGLMQSMIRDDGTGDRYDPAMYRAFRTLVVDESHHVPSATFSQVIPRFEAAYLLGLSATFRRADGAEDVFYHQIGPVVYTAKSRAMVPAVRVLHSRTELRPIQRGWDPVKKAWRYEVETDKLNSAQVLTQLAEDAERTRLIVDQVVRAARAGRKVMVVSQRLEHLREMSKQVRAAVPDVTQDYYTGQWYTGERWTTRGKGHRVGDPKLRDRRQEELDAAEGAQVLWVTHQMVAEAFDVPACDVLVLALPVSDMEQVAGRVQRWCLVAAGECARLCPWRAGTCQGKPDPVIIEVVDDLVPKVQGKWRKRRRFYREIGAKVGGET